MSTPNRKATPGGGEQPKSRSTRDEVGEALRWSPIDVVPPAAPVLTESGTLIHVKPEIEFVPITGTVPNPEDTVNILVEEEDGSLLHVDSYIHGNTTFNFNLPVPSVCRFCAIDSYGNHSVWTAPITVKVDSASPEEET